MVYRISVMTLSVPSVCTADRVPVDLTLSDNTSTWTPFSELFFHISVVN